MHKRSLNQQEKKKQSPPPAQWRQTTLSVCICLSVGRARCGLQKRIGPPLRPPLQLHTRTNLVVCSPDLKDAFTMIERSHVICTCPVLKPSHGASGTPMTQHDSKHIISDQVKTQTVLHLVGLSPAGPLEPWTLRSGYRTCPPSRTRRNE